MYLKQLECFYAVSVFGSVTRAAKSLGISAPAVVYSIRTFEEEIGVQLYTNGNRYIEVTEAGKLILEHAKVILDDCNNLELEIDSLKRGDRRLVRLSFFMGDKIPDLIFNCYRKRNPRVRIEIDQNSAEGVRKAVLNKESDIGITVANYDPNLEVRPCGRIELGILVGKSSPLYGIKSIDFSELKNIEICVPQFEKEIENTVRRYLHDQDIEAIIRKVPCGVYSRNAVEFNEQGVFIFPYTEISQDDDICFIHLMPTMYINQSVIWRKGGTLDTEVLELVEFLSSNIDNP